MPITTCVFDAYGTLFDVSAAARIAAQEDGMEALAESWPALAEDWRRKQLEYSWMRAMTGQHCDFWQVTQDGLDWAMEARGITGAAVRDRLLQLYRELAAYPEVPAMLRQLKEMGLTTAILSNGSPGMLSDAVTSAGVGDLLDAILSVESVGIFKPAAQVYDLVEERFGTRADQVLFVSSNGWDAASAKSYGFTVAWANRRGDPVDRLPGRPDHVVSDLSRITELKVF
jgi:2-haloacid dehalogenase